MQAANLFHQNFAVAESLLQLYQIFHGLKKADLKDELRLAVCSHWGDPPHAVVHPACNDRVMVLARSVAPIPEALTSEGGLDFLLRQAVVVACTSLEAFFWDVLRENVLTIVKARPRGADESLQKLTFTLGDYMSIQQWGDPDERLRQIILKNFERGTLYNTASIDRIAGILTVPPKQYWELVQKVSGEDSSQLNRKVSDLINRRNQIAHRADRPSESETPDGLGLRPITFAWTNSHVQAARTLVTASVEIFTQAMARLESDIRAAEEQALARKLAAKRETKEIAAP